MTSKEIRDVHPTRRDAVKAAAKAEGARVRFLPMARTSARLRACLELPGAGLMDQAHAFGRIRAAAFPNDGGAQ